jgi:hypothetical protein
MDEFSSHRAQSPGCSRAHGAVGDVRLHHILRALILSLLAVLLGRRHQPVAWHLATVPLPIDCDGSAQDWWIVLPGSESEPDLDACLAAGLSLQLRRVLYLFGARRNRGMRALPRALPPSRAPIARAPPARVPAHPNLRQLTPNWGGASARPSLIQDPRPKSQSFFASFCSQKEESSSFRPPRS